MAASALEAVLNTPTSEMRQTPMGQILVIEHDGVLQEILRRLFSAEAYEVDVVSDCAVGLEMLRQRSPSAMIVDMENVDTLGCNLCQKIADLIPGLPLAILSTSSKVADKVLLWKSAPMIT